MSQSPKTLLPVLVLSIVTKAVGIEDANHVRQCEWRSGAMKLSLVLGRDFQALGFGECPLIGIEGKERVRSE